jgi:regulatory protein
MKITKMLRRRGHIYEVRFDDDTYINVDVTLAEDKRLKEGMDFTDDEIFALEDESEVIRCTSRALYYLGRSDKSEKALYNKLIKAGFSENAAEKAVKRMKELSYINDEDYAVNQARKLSEAGFSRRESVNRLIKAGIPASKAKEVCTFDSDSEQEKIRRLIDKKYKSKTESPDEVQKTVAALLRRGFLFSDVRAVLKEYDSRLYSGEFGNE